MMNVTSAQEAKSMRVHLSFCVGAQLSCVSFLAFMMEENIRKTERCEQSSTVVIGFSLVGKAFF